MDYLPPNKNIAYRGRREAFHSLCLAPLEHMTKSLRMNDGWDLIELRPFVDRCRALVAAYDNRMKEVKDETQ